MSEHEEVVNILAQLRAKVAAGEDGGVYGNKSRAVGDIDSLLSSPSIENLVALIAPTGNLQELSLENGWGEEFNFLAGKIEKILGI